MISQLRIVQMGADAAEAIGISAQIRPLSPKHGQCNIHSSTEFVSKIGS